MAPTGGKRQRWVAAPFGCSLPAVPAVKNTTFTLARSSADLDPAAAAPGQALVRGAAGLDPAPDRASASAAAAAAAAADPDSCLL